MVLSADRPVFRFAPSPNGELHLGHAYSALLNDRLARQAGGGLLLRIEDIDRERCTPEFEAGIYRDLDWLGIDWEKPARRQSEHFDEYRTALERLTRDGLVYPAFMSRGDIRAFVAGLPDGGKVWPHDPDGAPHYPPVDKALAGSERHRRVEAGQPFAWRLDMERAAGLLGNLRTNPAPEKVRAGDDLKLTWQECAVGLNDEPAKVEADPHRWGDVILARKDVPTSYNLSVVLDDALQGVTHVVRGQDLFEATSIHRLLQELLGLPEPVYHHHRLVLGPDGRKLSKSFRDTGLRALRESGWQPGDVRERVGLV